MRRIFLNVMAIVLLCAMLIPMIASCEVDLGAKKSKDSDDGVWYSRKDSAGEYYLSFNEKKGTIVVVSVSDKNAESFNFSYELDDEEITIKDTTKKEFTFSYKEKSDSYVVIDGVKFKLTEDGPSKYSKGSRELSIYEVLGKLGESVMSGSYMATFDDGTTTTITFTSDGTVSIMQGMQNGVGSGVLMKQGTYEIKDGVMYVTINGETEIIEFTFDGKTFTADGIEYHKANNMSIITTMPSVSDTAKNERPDDPDYSKDYEVTIHPTDDPHYTVEPDVSMDVPSYTYPGDGPIATERPSDTEKVEDINGRFNATYESKDTGTDVYYRFTFSEKGEWILYEMTGSRGSEVNRGTYKIRSGVLMFYSDGDLIDEVELYSYGDMFDLEGMTFFRVANFIEPPANIGGSTTDPEMTAVIGTYDTFDNDCDGYSCVLVFDAGMYTLYEIDMKTAREVDKGTYTYKSGVVTISSVYSGTNEKIKMMDGTFNLYGFTFYRTSSIPEHPEVGALGGLNNKDGFFAETFISETVLINKQKAHYRWIFFIDGTYHKVQVFDNGKSKTVDEGNYTTKDKNVFITSWTGDSSFNGTFVFADDYSFIFGAVKYTVNDGRYDFIVPETEPMYSEAATGFDSFEIDSPLSDEVVAYGTDAERKYVVSYIK